MSSPLKIVVTVATYKRPRLLKELLESLNIVHRETPFEMIVIDNDPAGSGAGVVSGSELPITYAVEPTPGIVAARNAALDRLPADTTHVVFVDDDETVPPGWLGSLLAVGDRYGVDIVCGPVDSVFLEGSPKWIVKGGYIQRSAEAEGVTSRLPATNNTIVSMDLIHRAGGIRFDESFSQTGGSDSHFFSRLIAQGATVAWAPTARVSEVVPLDRLTFRWVMRRYIRINNVSGRLLLQTMSRPRLAAKAVLSIAYGVPKTLFALIRGKGLRLVDTRYITRGIGWWGAAFGNLVQEYARPSTGTR
jgi:succinoglycan biosynthesis protein ExoM